MSSAEAEAKMRQYIVKEKLGAGTYGQVYRIRRVSDKKAMVWKEINYGDMSKKEVELLGSELNILRTLSHPNIVRYYDHIVDHGKKRMYIVMELCEGGDLTDVIKRHKAAGTRMSENTWWRILTQVTLAVRECHSRREGRILHRDIKPANVLLDRAGNAKLGDFGLARELGTNSYFAKTNVGTPLYMAPELVRECAYNEKCDIWAIGCMMYELAALRPPFHAKNQLALAHAINAGRYHPMPSAYSKDVHRIVGAMLMARASERPSIEDILHHPKVNAFRVEMKRKAQEEYTKERLRAMEAAEKKLARRKEELDAREKLLAKREAELVARERSVAKREAAMAVAQPQHVPPTLGKRAAKEMAAVKEVVPVRRVKSDDALAGRRARSSDDAKAPHGAKKRRLEDLLSDRENTHNVRKVMPTGTAAAAADKPGVAGLPAPPRRPALMVRRKRTALRTRTHTKA